MKNYAKAVQKQQRLLRIAAMSWLGGQMSCLGALAVWFMPACPCVGIEKRLVFFQTVVACVLMIVGVAMAAWHVPRYPLEPKDGIS